MDNSNLNKLLAIPGWGKATYTGAHYKIKFRIPVKDADWPHIKTLRARYPVEMILYTSKTGFWIIGGTFPKSSDFLFFAKRLLKINTHEPLRSSH